VPQCRPLASSSETKPFYHLANVQRMHVLSVCLQYCNIIWLPWQLPLTNWKIRYRSIICVKRFHMVKRLQKSVQYIRRYSTRYASFWPCHTRCTQISPVISGATRQKFTTFLDDVASSSPLLTRTARPCYLARSANLPTGLYILLALISFFF